MTYLKNTTQKAEQMLRAYNYYKGKSKGDSLFEIYGSFTKKKDEALRYCLRLRYEKHGTGSCFGGHNCYFFTYMFTYEENGKKYLAYITHGNDYAIEIEGA